VDPRGAQPDLSEVEFIKSSLAKQKINIPTKSLSKALVFDNELRTASTLSYPEVADSLQKNPFADKGEVKNRKRK